MDGVLGCGDYDAYAIPRGGGRTIVADVPWSQVSWARVLDDTSPGSVQSDRSNCTKVRDVFPWRHELAIYRDKALVWVGPILTPSGTVQTDHTQFAVDARDLSAWWDHRLIHNDHDYVVPTDLATIFADLVNDAMAPDPSPGVTIAATPCGVLGVMSVLASQHQLAGQQLRDLAGIGIDWTALKRQILAGGATIPVAPLGVLRDEHFVAPPTVKRDGTAQTNLWVVRGSGGGAAGDDIFASASVPDAVALDGLLESVDSVSTIQDFDSAQAAANSRTALTSAIVTVEQAVLAPTAPLTVDQLVPGALCQLELHQTELPVSGQFRLQRVDAVCNVASGSINEAITLTFQPVGTT